MDIILAKTDKRARETEKCQITEPGMKFLGNHLKYASLVLQESYLDKNGPWITLSQTTDLVPEFINLTPFTPKVKSLKHLSPNPILILNHNQPTQVQYPNPVTFYPNLLPKPKSTNLVNV